MGKIFGISDLPVSHFMSPFEPVSIPQPAVRNVAKLSKNMPSKANFALANDSLELSSKVPATKSNPVIKMRNGFGKLMNSFQRKSS